MAQATKRVHEIEIASDSDHSTHENTLAVLVVESSMADAIDRATELVDEQRPDFIGEDASAIHCGSSSLESSEAWARQRAGDLADVITGPEVPV